MTKTVTLNGEIMKVALSKDDETYFYSSTRYVWIMNKTSGSVYCSADENESGVVEIKSGMSYRMKITPHSAVYLKGTGDVTVITSDIPDAPFAVSGDNGSGGGGSSIDYNTLSNLPTINGVTLKGDLTLEDLGLEELSEDQMSALMALI